MIEFVTLDNEENWINIIKKFNQYDVYYLPGYIKAFELNGDGEPILVHYNYNNLRGVNVVLKRDVSNVLEFQNKIQKGKYFDFSTPYGYGGFIFEGDISRENLLQFDIDYTKLCVANNIISEFVRFHPVLNNGKVIEDIYNVERLGSTVTIELFSKEEVWGNYSSKNRNVIRKAIKSGVEVYWGNDSSLINTFIPMYNKTMDRDNASDYYYFNRDFYESIIKELKYNMMFFYAKYNGKIIAMAMILMANNQMHYHLSASNPSYNKLAPTNLLLYEASNWGIEHGYETFHLGGGVGSQEDSLYKFKKAFSKVSNTYFSIGKKIFSEDIYEDFVEIKFGSEPQSINENNNYFPAYRK